MIDTADRAIAIVGLEAVMPGARDGATFWQNIKNKVYSISEVHPDRWDPALYYDADIAAPDKSYTKIGGWVRDFEWEPMKWRLPIPPKVSEQLDDGQKWSVALSRGALMQAGWPKWNVDDERVAVILGNAIGGEKHYSTSMRIQFPEFARELRNAPSFQAVPENIREQIIAEAHKSFAALTSGITEDTMPGELANIIAGRVANLFNFRGPNFTTDAACASGLAAINSAMFGLANHEFDVAVTGGVDRNMGIAAFVKFCKIGALSATGTRPFDAGADGFVMGEGASIFIMKRLADAERNGDTIYAVMTGIAGSSDGKGKGITAPNPVGQRIAVQRAWVNASVDPATVGLMEAHGTSTRVGDAAELSALGEVFGKAGAEVGSIALGSVKSNIGHLKAAAGTAGLFKAVMSLHEKVLPPSLNFNVPNPNLDWASSAFKVNTELREWANPVGGIRRAGVSAFGFGGTNFHAVLEEHVPGRFPANGRKSFAGASVPAAQSTSGTVTASVGGSPAAPVGAQALAAPRKAPLRGALVVGGADDRAVADRLAAVAAQAAAGQAPAPAAPDPTDLRAPVRVAIDYVDAVELADKAEKARKALVSGVPAMWKALRARGVFLGRGPAPKTAFLYTGQGSQYVNMLKELRATEPIVTETFAEADRIMTPLLGKPLSDYIFIDGDDPAAVKQLTMQLLQTEITQPAVLTTDLALTRLLDAYGIAPDMVMGHSLGEYGALVAAGVLNFEHALEAVSARGREMANVDLGDKGAMAAVIAPMPEIERIVGASDGYVVIANVNSNSQAVIGGETPAVQAAVKVFQDAGFTAIPLPVSHAFHTRIVAAASEPLKVQLARLGIQAPKLPLVANVDGEFYPTGGPDVQAQVLDILGKQVASPVQFVKGLRTLYDAGARVFVEVGPKKALHGFAEDVLGSEHDDVVALFTNHPKSSDVAAFNQALCGMYAAGLGVVESAPAAPVAAAVTAPVSAPAPVVAPAPVARSTGSASSPSPASNGASMTDDRYRELGRLFADFLDRGHEVYSGAAPAPSGPGWGTNEPVVVTGAGLGLPGGERVFDDMNVAKILRGEQFIDLIPSRFRSRMVDKNIVRLVKGEDGSGSFQTIDNTSEVIKLAARAGALDVVAEYGIDEERNKALDVVTKLAIGAGFDALRDAGIPLVMHYKTTSIGTQLATRWALPDAMRDDTGVILASAFPGIDAFADEVERYVVDRERHRQLDQLAAIRARVTDGAPVAADIDRRINELRATLEAEPYLFNRRFLFKALSMGHAQFGEIIGARGPNTQINSACASTTQAIAIAQDWINAGRCRRVIVISGDDATSEHLMEWIGSGFLASGAAATDDVVENAALPFDNRRHGMIIGMGAAALVVEAAEAARDRGIQPIAEILGSVTANSAFHGSRLDIEHISGVMEDVVSQAEARGVRRHDIAPETVFVSHETYTPARGGSAAAEINALRSVFGADADRIVIANTKGFTGHPMAVGVEDITAVKMLETGIIPPIPNFKEIDPALGALNLSKGGAYPVQYALRLAAGFGSQISMALFRWTPMPDRARRSPENLGYLYRIIDAAAWQDWLTRMTGYPDAQLEVVQRRLRVADVGAPVRKAEPARIAATAAVPTASVPASEAVDELPTPLAPTVPAPVPAQAPAPAPVPVATAAPAAAADPVTDKVLAVVAEVTGYPEDMLALELDLEADLGVDTVKQAEVFATIRETFGIERDENLKLRDYPTLEAVIGFVRDRAGIPAPSAAPAAAPAVPVQASAPAPAPTSVPAAPAADSVTETVLSVVAEVTGYPQDMLDLELDLEADLGVDTVKQAEVFATIRETFGIERDENLKLRDYPTLQAVIGFVRDRAGIPAPSAAPAAAPAVPVQVAVPAQAAVSAAPTSVPAAPAADSVTETVLSVVAEVTGYPPEMLDLDLDLEADLGVDTVKQAEVFATIRETFGIERDENLKLRDYPTLAAVIGFVRDRAGIPAPSAAVSDGATAAPDGAAVGDPMLERAVPAAGSVEAPAAPAPVAAEDPVVAKVLEVVADKTGYPPEMLDLDLDLEADLGVDTVKQAEVFATIREHFGIERDEDLKLRDYPTLAAVIGFVRDRAHLEPPATPAGSKGQVAAEAAVAAPEPEAPAAMRIVGSIEAADRVPRRVPVSVLRPPLGLTKSTGVSLSNGARVVVAADKGGVADALIKRLRKLDVQVLSLDVTADNDAIDEQLGAWLADGPVTGVYWLPGLDEAGPVEAMDLPTWREALRRRVKALYTTMRKLYDGNPFLVSATRLGGRHGYDERGALNPLGGAVTGFTKSYKREKADVLVKAVDFEAGRKTAVLADRLVDETLADPGCVEVGYADNQRWTVSFEERPAADGNPGMELGPETVFVITGAAGSIVSAIIADLANAAAGGVFHLLDLTPEPDPANDDLRMFTRDHDGLKARIIERRKAAGERVTPVMVERELAGIERGAAALAAIESVQSAGGTARYHSVDLTNADAVGAVGAEIAQSSGRVDVLVHAAGIEISRNLPDKEPREYNLVFDVKSDGWFNLMHAIGSMPLGATVGFSSVAGRFGNLGQTDYSAANDLLCKLASSMRNNRPETRGIAIDWTAWGGIGMATRGSIPKIMEAAGIDVLPPEAGVATVRRELTAGGTRGEIVVAGRLGMMGTEFDPTGGLDVEKIDVSTSGPMVGRVVEMGIHSGLVVETTLDPTEQKFLDDHRVDGIPMLPGVMGVEAFGEVARLLWPDRHVTAVENVEYSAPVKFYRDQPRTLTVSARFRADGDDVVAACRLTASRTLPNRPEPQVTTHFLADVRLSTAPLPADSAEKPGEAPDSAVAAEDIYQIYFHGPAFQVLEKAWGAGEGVDGLFASNLPAGHVPAERPLVMAPRLIELCFQTAGVYEIGTTGRMALPLHIDRVVVPRQPKSTVAPLVAQVVPRDGGFDARVVDAAGHVIIRLENYRTVVLPAPIDADRLAPLQQAMATGDSTVIDVSDGDVPAETPEFDGGQPVAADGEVADSDGAQVPGSNGSEPVDQPVAEDGAEQQGEGEPVVAEATSES